MTSNDLPRSDPFAAALDAQRRSRADLLERFLGPVKAEDGQQGTAGKTGPQDNAQGRSGGTS